MFEKSDQAIFTDGPIEPKQCEGDRHRQGHVEVGIATAQERAESVMGITTETIGIVLTNRADAGKQTEPVGEEDENENRAEEPEGLFDQMLAEDAFEKVIEAFHQPFDEILQTRWNQSNVASGKLRDENDDCGDDPDHQHRVTNGNWPQAEKFLCVNWQMIMTSTCR